MWDGTTEFDSDGDNDDQNMLHFVRIQKSFLGDLSADSYMDVSDSIYYHSDDLDVWVELVNADGQISDEYPLELATASDLANLKEDGDFRSNECIDLLKQSDIVVTNPPFSLFREYVEQLINYKKDFCFLKFVSNNQVLPNQHPTRIKVCSILVQIP